MTAQEAIARVRELDEKAGRGPWHVGHIDENLDRGEIVNKDGLIVTSDCLRSCEGFICDSRTLLPKLAKALEWALELTGCEVICSNCTAGITRKCQPCLVREEIEKVFE